ncbi:MAG: MATE family efflux transporter, partial [Polyangiaceae bacterium]
MDAKLTTGSIPRHLVTQTAPMLLGIAAVVSIGIVDAYFIGQLGPRELAAVSFIFPVSLALASLGVGVIAGISSVVARALGRGEPRRAQQLGNLGMLSAVATGVVVAVTLYLVRLPLFRLMGADDELLAIVDAYVVPFALGFPLLLANMGGNGVLRGQGAATRASAILIGVAIANWVLDPLLITGAGTFEGFGIAGAAYATIGGWLLGLILAIVFVQRSAIRFDLTSVTGCDLSADLRALARVAGPAAASNAINPVGLSVLTALLAKHGDAAVAGFGAAGRLQSFAVVPMLAMSSSIGAIVGQNWGAEKYDRARHAFLGCAAFGIAYGLAVAAAFVAARGWLARLFSEDPGGIAAIETYSGIAAWGFSGFGVLVVANGALSA